MADSYWQGTANGSTTVFSVPFPYLQPADVVVQLNGVTMLSPGDYVWLNAGSIQFKVAPPNGTAITIARSTSPDAVDVSFNNGAVLTAADLNTAVLQCFYRTQELQDQLNTYINAGVARYSVTGANPLVSPSDLLTSAADAALQTSVATQLLGALTSIDINSNNILTNTNQISTLQATLDSLTSGVPGGIGTYLTNETNSRISGDQALQQQIDLIGAVNGGNTAFILNLNTVYTDSSTSLATYLNALQATVNQNVASISNEASVRAAADSANASSISSLSTTVSGNTASITTLQTSVNGLDAQYVVRLDVNGHVAGFGLASGAGGTSDFTIVANKFSIIDPGNGLSSPVVPLTVSGGVVYMANVVIGGALIQDLTIGTGKLANNAATSTWFNEYDSYDSVTYASTALHSLYSGVIAGYPYLPHNILTFTADADGTCIVTAVTTLYLFETGNMSTYASGTCQVGAVVIRTDTNAVVAYIPTNFGSVAANYAENFTTISGGNLAVNTLTLRGSFSAVSGVPYKVYILSLPESLNSSNYYTAYHSGTTISAELIKK